MTVARRTKRRTKLERQTQEVIGDLLGGLTQEQAAAKYGVQPSSMSNFVRRHAEEISQRSIAIAKQAEDYQIASKVWRIGEYESLYGVAKAEITAAEDTNGRMTAVKAASGALRAVAEELGALPRPDQNINVKAMMLIRQVEGADIEELS